jgi:hypothetical protein
MIKRIIYRLFACALLAFPAGMRAQVATADTCYDKVYLRGGSLFRGHLREYVAGEKVALMTSQGALLHLPADQVRRIVQYCPEDKRTALPAGPKPYAFRERGWYHHTRVAMLPGQNFSGEFAIGASLQHTSGWMLRRTLGIGLGLAAESYHIYSERMIATYPVFAEARGYLRPRNVTAYYAVGGGWGFAGRQPGSDAGRTEHWEGGWMAKAQIGIRLGNHFTVHSGLTFQRAVVDWTNNWWIADRGTDRHLFKRMEIGFGVLL